MASTQDIIPGEDVDLATFGRWSVPALKEFLRVRGVKTTVLKEELVALAFAAHQFQLPVKMTEQEKETVLLESYKDLLTVDDVVYPDPLAKQLTEGEGWIGEQRGMEKWPPTMYHDVCIFLLNEGTGGIDLAKKAFNDYKEKKGYSYLTSGFLQEIFFNGISNTSKMCYLKATCRPSQKINNVHHDCWVMICKDSGEIKRAFCTCIAGRGQSCLHITALLMKVDLAWKFGLTNPACTSKECVWISKPKLNITPMQVKDMPISSPKYGRQPKNINTVSKQLFVPHSSGKGKSLLQFLDDVKSIVPDATIYTESYECPPKRRREVSEPKLPRSMAEIVSDCVSVDELLQNVFDECSSKVSMVEKETRKQTRSEYWHKIRQGRLTASLFHDVATKTKSFEKKKSAINTSQDPLISKLTSGKETPANKFMKYGISMEPNALQNYLNLRATEKHVNDTSSPCGFFMDENKPFIGASPDYIINCQCHGKGFLEIKCPYTSSHTKPLPEVCKYLEYTAEGQIQLKKTHKYYAQVQGQMGVLKVKYCHFWVYSNHGYHYETIDFDADYWFDLYGLLDTFWVRYLAPVLIELKGHSGKASALQPSLPVQQLQCTKEIPSTITTPILGVPSTSSTEDVPRMITSVATEEIPSSSTNVIGDVPCTSSTVDVPSLITEVVTEEISDTVEQEQYICSACEKECKNTDEIKNKKDYSIGCDGCNKWFHLPCVKLNTKSKELSWPQWFCPFCCQ